MTADRPTPTARTAPGPRYARRLLWKLALAAIPPLLIAGPIAALWLQVGEFATAAAVVEAQQGAGPVLFGQAYSNRARVYKWLAATTRRAQVLALGSSRVLQFRSEAFSSTFYNAGSTIDCLDDLEPFLAAIPPSAQPSHVLLGLDQWWFSRTYESPGCRGFTTVDEPVLQSFAAGWLYTWSDLLAGKLTFSNAWRTPTALDRRIGLNARLNGNGFRNDGSYAYGGVIADPENPAKNPDIGFAGTLERLRSGSGRFTPARGSFETHLDTLRRFLRECRRRGIQVTAFLAPYPHVVVEEMRSRRDRYRYLWDLPAAAARLGAEEGITIADMTDLADIGRPDRECVDGFHCGEKTYLEVLLRLSQQDLQLRRHVRDPEGLRRKLDQETRRFEVF